MRVVAVFTWRLRDWILRGEIDAHVCVSLSYRKDTETRESPIKASGERDFLECFDKRV